MEGAPRGRPGPLTDVERFLWESAGYLIVVRPPHALFPSTPTLID